jgi:hypothetical protein
VSSISLSVTATFEDGVLRPDEALPLAPHQRVTLLVQIPGPAEDWPENVADIYRELADEDRRLADAMFTTVRDTWPAAEGSS